MIARTSRGIVRDHGVLQRCLRAIRLHVNKLAYDNSPDAVAKLQQLETQQFAIESFLEALVSSATLAEKKPLVYRPRLLGLLKSRACSGGDGSCCLGALWVMRETRSPLFFLLAPSYR